MDLATFQKLYPTRKFEAHITCPRDASETVKSLTADGHGDWVFSAIDGDPIMGKLAYCYLTAYDVHAETLIARLNAKAAAIRKAGVLVLREKMEEIIYDSKTGHDRLEACCGRCGEP